MKARRIRVVGLVLGLSVAWAAQGCGGHAESGAELSSRSLAIGDGGATCGENQVCETGKTCLDGKCGDELCKTTQCPTGTICVQGKCETQCGEGVCLSGQDCQGGKCVTVEPQPTLEPYEETICESGLICQDGKCVPDPCNSVLCPTDQVCRQGKCERSEPEPIKPCPIGQILKDSKCVPDPCETARCRPDQNCEPKAPPAGE
jgi:hypothetical protein